MIIPINILTETKYEAPAQIDDTVAKLLQLYALRLWKAFCLSGYARIDFRYDDLKPYFTGSKYTAE